MDLVGSGVHFMTYENLFMGVRLGKGRLRERGVERVRGGEGKRVKEEEINKGKY